MQVWVFALLFIITVGQLRASDKKLPEQDNTNRLHDSKYLKNNLGLQGSSISGSGITYQRIMGNYAVQITAMAQLGIYELGEDPVLEEERELQYNIGLALRRRLHQFELSVIGVKGLGGVNCFVGGQYGYEENKDNDREEDLLSYNYAGGLGMGFEWLLTSIKVYIDLALKYDYQKEKMYRKEYDEFLPSYEHSLIPAGSIGIMFVY